MSFWDQKQIIFAPTEDAAQAIIDTTTRALPIISSGASGTLIAIAPADAVFSIAIEIPAILSQEPDVANDDHWQPLTDEYGEDIVLANTAANAAPVPAGLLVRAKKAATAGYAVGLVWI